MRYVLDTNIIISGLRSPRGASASLLNAALDGTFTPLLSVALVFEYEAVATDPAQRIVSGLSETEVETVVNALCSIAQPVESHFLWRPQLRDPADEMVLETAINGQADGLVTFNARDFEPAATQFDIPILTPQQLLKLIETKRTGR